MLYSSSLSLNEPESVHHRDGVKREGATLGLYPHTLLESGD